MRSCTPFFDSIHIEKEKDKFIVKWVCDTAGCHHIGCDTLKKAEEEVKQLKEIAIQSS